MSGQWLDWREEPASILVLFPSIYLLSELMKVSNFIFFSSTLWKASCGRSRKVLKSTFSAATVKRGIGAAIAAVRDTDLITTNRGAAAG